MSNVVQYSPKQLAENVFYCGLESASGYGGKSYIVLHEHGNWMIDSPHYSQPLVNWLHENGGLKYIFLTHRGDVGEEYDYAWEFGAQRIMHAGDLEAEQNAEIVLHGLDAKRFENDFVAIPTPGHTPGHCMLLYKDEYLFSGDVLTADERFNEGLEVNDPFYCFWSWQEQTDSIQRLMNYEFTKTLPAHGASFSTRDADSMRKHLANVIFQCKREEHPDPASLERISVFEDIADHAIFNEQYEWARLLRKRIQDLQSRL